MIDYTHLTPTYLIQFFQEFYREVLIQREAAKKSLHNLADFMGSKEADLTEEKDALEQTEEMVASLKEATPSDETAFEPHEEYHPTSEVGGPRVVEPGESLASEEILVREIQERFTIMFEKFSLSAQAQAGEFAATHFHEVLYAMVALLDEVFLAFQWHGQRQWENNLMEKKFFQTQIAGELIFRKIDKLIEEYDPVRWDLAAIYLMLLALGFKGKFKGEDDGGQIHWYRQQLYILMNKHPSSLYHPGRKQLIDECYEHNISIPITSGLPHLKNWFIAFSAIVGIYVIISSFVWYNLVRDMNDSIGQILTQSKKL